MGMLLAMTMMEQEQARKQAETHVEEPATTLVVEETVQEEKPVESPKTPVKRAVRKTRKTTAKRKTSK